MTFEEFCEVGFVIESIMVLCIVIYFCIKG